MPSRRDNAFRFCVGTPNGPRSAVWRVWNPRGKNDVYVAVRALGGTAKVSLHADGQCNASLTQDFVRRHPGVGKRLTRGRHFYQWKRDTFLVRTAQLVMWVAIPASELRVTGHRKDDRDVVWIPAPPSSASVNVGCVFSRPGFAPGHWPGSDNGARLLANVALPSGEWFHLVYVTNPIPDDLPPRLDAERARVAAVAKPGNRLFVIASAWPKGDVHLIDAAATRPALPTE
jgi:hypothetical protein